MTSLIFSLRQLMVGLCSVVTHLHLYLSLFIAIYQKHICFCVVLINLQVWKYGNCEQVQRCFFSSPSSSSSQRPGCAFFWNGYGLQLLARFSSVVYQKSYYDNQHNPSPHFLFTMLRTSMFALGAAIVRAITAKKKKDIPLGKYCNIAQFVAIIIHEYTQYVWFDIDSEMHLMRTSFDVLSWMFFDMCQCH